MASKLNQLKSNPINYESLNSDLIQFFIKRRDYRNFMVKYREGNINIAIDINRYVIKSMRKKKWGRIVNISSISALENQGSPSYCAAKAALNAYTRSVGRHISKDNIIMTSVMPGAIKTEGGYWDLKSKLDKKHVRNFIKNRMAINRFGTVKEISNFVVFLSSDKASFCPGSSFLVDGGQGRVFNQ